MGDESLSRGFRKAGCGIVPYFGLGARIQTIFKGHFTLPVSKS